MVNKRGREEGSAELRRVTKKEFFLRVLRVARGTALCFYSHYNAYGAIYLSI